MSKSKYYDTSSFFDYVKQSFSSKVKKVFKNRLKSSIKALIHQIEVYGPTEATLKVYALYGYEVTFNVRNKLKILKQAYKNPPDDLRTLKKLLKDLKPKTISIINVKKFSSFGIETKITLPFKRVIENQIMLGGEK